MTVNLWTEAAPSSWQIIHQKWKIARHSACGNPRPFPMKWPIDACSSTIMHRSDWETVSFLDFFLFDMREEIIFSPLVDHFLYHHKQGRYHIFSIKMSSRQKRVGAEKEKKGKTFPLEKLLLWRTNFFNFPPLTEADTRQTYIAKQQKNRTKVLILSHIVVTSNNYTNSRTKMFNLIIFICFLFHFNH
jgi:hypothetical protein